MLSILHVHLQGQVRLPFIRQLIDHSSIVTPLNAFVHLFSGVLSTPYLPSSNFQLLRKLDANWESIRDEALQLHALQKIKAAEKMTMPG